MKILFIIMTLFITGCYTSQYIGDPRLDAHPDPKDRIDSMELNPTPLNSEMNIDSILNEVYHMDEPTRERFQDSIQIIINQLNHTIDSLDREMDTIYHKMDSIRASMSFKQT